jgi:phosphoglycerate-specific signal transduction histidine kinase
MDREMKAHLKNMKNNKNSKIKQLKEDFDQYKIKNDVKVSAIIDLRNKNEKLNEAIKLALMELENNNLMNDMYWRIQTLLDSE